MVGVRREIREMAQWLAEVRHDLHAHPELKFQEHRTAQRVADALEGWGLETRAGVGRTGVLGLWRSGTAGPFLGLRADMDALPIQEAGDRAHASRTPGIMHACGHDAHVTMLLGAARYLAERGGPARGGVKFIFQPGEEGGGGARLMVEDGALADPPLARVLALHAWPSLRVGQFGYTCGAALASVDDFVIRILGRGAHAAHPHQARDPILAGTALIQAIQGIVSRSTNPLDSLVVSVTTFHAGTAHNIIPEAAEITGTIRSLREAVREETHEAVRRVARGVAEAHGLEIAVEIHRGYPVLRNDDAVVSFAAGLARDMVGPDNTVELPASMGSEDFSYFLERCPGAFLVVGCGRPEGESPMLHTPQFDVDDSMLPFGVEFLVRSAEAFLG
jgi:hippurate hydrolase